MMLKQLDTDYQQFLDFYRKDSCFTDENGDFYFEILNRIRDDANTRSKVGMFYTNSLFDIEYTKWTPSMIYQSFIHYYFNGNADGFAGINSPILADSPIALFLTMPKYQDDIDSDFEQKLLPLFKQIVKYEIKRINRTKNQNETKAKNIANFNERGLLFNYFTELNSLHTNEILVQSADEQG